MRLFAGFQLFTQYLTKRFLEKSVVRLVKDLKKHQKNKHKYPEGFEAFLSKKFIINANLSTSVNSPAKRKPENRPPLSPKKQKLDTMTKVKCDVTESLLWEEKIKSKTLTDNLDSLTLNNESLIKENENLKQELKSVKHKKWGADKTIADLKEKAHANKVECQNSERKSNK